MNKKNLNQREEVKGGQYRTILLLLLVSALLITKIQGGQ